MVSEKDIEILATTLENIVSLHMDTTGHYVRTLADSAEAMRELKDKLAICQRSLHRIANLNENAGEIGDGMLRTIVIEARTALTLSNITLSN